MAYILDSLRGRIGELGHEALSPNAKRALAAGLAFAVIVPLVVYRFLNHRDATNRTVVSAAAPTSEASPYSNVSEAAKDTESVTYGDSSTMTLPDGDKVQASTQGMEYRLVKYVDSRAQSTGTWFNFDRLTYSTGQALPNQVTQEQVENLAKIMKSYPDLNVVIGGFADGSSKSARRLSDARAKNIKSELVALGVEQSRITAKGFGDDRPANDGRADISLFVTKK
jgi:outer membrane protein OmpA-like peptidoglycan-associated protein